MTKTVMLAHVCLFLAREAQSMCFTLTMLMALSLRVSGARSSPESRIAVKSSFVALYIIL